MISTLLRNFTLSIYVCIIENICEDDIAINCLLLNKTLRRPEWKY